MKGPQLAMLVWLANLVLFGGGGLLGYKIYSEITADRASDTRTISEMKSKQKREDWLAKSSAKEAQQQQDFASDKLSMRARPKPPVKPPPPVDPPPPKPDPTDEELKAELQKWLNDKFTLQRILFGPPTLASATVIAKDAGNASLRIHTTMHFATFFKDTKDKSLEKLKALDMTCIEIKEDRLVFKAPSVNSNAKFRNKFFEVELTFPANTFKPITLGGEARALTPPPSGTKIEIPKEIPPDPRVEIEDTRPKASVYDQANDTWTLGTDDYVNINVDELAKYAKVVHDAEGKPLGIQISEEIPEDNVVLGRGGRRGDIIKAINGKPVTSMSDVRRVVRQDYDAGVEEFTVEYERDGLPGRKIFKAPKKKNTGTDGK